MITANKEYFISTASSASDITSAREVVDITTAITAANTCTIFLALLLIFLLLVMLHILLLVLLLALLVVSIAETNAMWSCVILHYIPILYIFVCMYVCFFYVYFS